MKSSARLRAGRGFSLIELMVAMGISVVLMAALASIFATSVKTREKIDLEGQKIETARYSLDTLAEDIRLAGYYGDMAPSVPVVGIVNGAVPADWKYVDPWSTSADPSTTSPLRGDLPGWSIASVQNLDSGISSIDVPMPIFGYEAHGGGTLPPALTAVLDNYRTGTDVLVIRRASTITIVVGDTTNADPARRYVPGDPYLQTSTCAEGTVDALAKYPPRFVAKATTTNGDFNLHTRACAATVFSPVRKLITRIYYISACDDCGDAAATPPRPSDGIPTLKMVELGRSGTALSLVNNRRTIAPGVDNIHLEYGIDTTGDGSVDAWVESVADPRRESVSSGAATGTLVTGMRCHRPTTPPPDSTACDNLAENRWEDVMAVKLFLITRDLKPTKDFDAAKSFVMASRTLAVADDDYRRRMTSSTIKLVNMAGRRETPP